MTFGNDRTLAAACPLWEMREESTWPHYLTAAWVVVGITLPAFLLLPVVGHRAIALIYLLAVVLMALFIGRGATLFAAGLSALLWDFCFLAPITKLRIASAEDVVMFGSYLVVALVLGQLTARMSEQKKAKDQGEERAMALYMLTRVLGEAASLDQLLQNAVQQTERVFDAQIVVLLPDSSRRLSYQAHTASTYDIPGPEQSVAERAFEERRPAGKFTENSPRADALYVPLMAEDVRVGVMGLRFNQSFPLNVRQKNLLEHFSHHIAVALNQHRLREESEAAKRLAESERLSKTLLNSVSHELRTPLAAISSATGNLAESKEADAPGFQQAMIREIQEAAERLNRVVGKVLDTARLESGQVTPKLDLCDVNDLVRAAIRETRNVLARHKVAIELAPGLPLVSMDFVLTQRALMHLLSNAAMHTPEGTPVQVTARIRDGALVLTVADRGPGIHPGSMPRIFDKFYRAPGAPTGGAGLGLPLAKGYVEIQGGEIKAENRFGGGAVFTIRLPVKRGH